MMRHLVAAEMPAAARQYRVLYDLTVVIGGSILLAACARVSFPIPFSPVPVTGQTFGVLVLGMLLGSWRASAAVGLYLLEGLAGLPVFAAGGGPAYFAGPTGGYLLAFLPAAWLTGVLAQRGWDRSHTLTVVAMSIGTAVILVGGCAWLTVLHAGDVAAVVSLGLTPFLPGSIIKIALAATVLPLGWRWFGRPHEVSERNPQ